MAACTTGTGTGPRNGPVRVGAESRGFQGDATYRAGLNAGVEKSHLAGPNKPSKVYQDGALTEGPRAMLKYLTEPLYNKLFLLYGSTEVVPTRHFLARFRGGIRHITTAPASNYRNYGSVAPRSEPALPSVRPDVSGAPDSPDWRLSRGIFENSERREIAVIRRIPGWNIPT